MTRGHEGNKLVGFWIPQQRYDQLAEFLNKFSTGQSFSDQFREFVFGTLNRKERISTARSEMFV